MKLAVSLLRQSSHTRKQSEIFQPLILQDSLKQS